MPSRERSQSAGRADPQRLHAQEDQEQASVDSKNLKNRKRSGAQSESKEGRSAPKLKIFIQNQTLQYVSLAPKRDDEKLTEEREATNTHHLNGAIECGGDEVEEPGQEDSEEAQCNLQEMEDKKFIDSERGRSDERGRLFHSRGAATRISRPSRGGRSSRSHRSGAVEKATVARRPVDSNRTGVRFMSGSNELDL